MIYPFISLLRSPVPAHSLVNVRLIGPMTISFTSAHDDMPFSIFD